MGCCVGKLHKDNDVCIICRYPCTSQVCNCSFMHEECAGEYFSHYNGRKCIICNNTFRRINLQPCPTIPKEDRILLMHSRKNRQHHIRKTKYTTRMWSNRIFPHVLGFYYRHGIKIRHNMFMSLSNICLDESNENAFKQYLLDKGMKDIQINRDLQMMHNIFSNYGVLPKSVKSHLISNFKRWNYEFESSDSEIELFIR